MTSIHEEAARRRKELMQHMEPDSIALLCAAPQATRSNDTEYPYRQNSDFYYLTGFVEHDAVLALIPGREQGEVVLFCQEKDKTRELWTGILTGPEQAVGKLLIEPAPVSVATSWSSATAPPTAHRSTTSTTSSPGSSKGGSVSTIPWARTRAGISASWSG